MRIYYFYYILIFLFISNFVKAYTNNYVNENPLLYSFNETIDFQNINAGDINVATTFVLSEADGILQEILNLSDTERTFDNTLLRLDDI